MRTIVIAAALLALASCSESHEPVSEEPGATEPGNAESETFDSVPAAYQGRWDFAEDTCTDPASEMRLDIEANRITYYESSATPETISQTAPDTLTINHLFSGEGEEWTETLAYTLSEDGDRLTVTSPDGSMSIRMRCQL